MRRRLLAISALLAMIGVGCVEADLGKVPLYCNPGEPQCPKGYRCVAYQAVEYCVRKGVDPASALGSSTDSGSRPDTDSAPRDATNPRDSGARSDAGRPGRDGNSPRDTSSAQRDGAGPDHGSGG